MPDLLDEMAWELDWMLRMQDTDGGVYHKLTSCNWFFGMPHEEHTPRLINPKSTHDTAFFAAAVAASSRVFAALHPDVSVGETYLAAAVAAWEFLLLHPGNALGEGVPTGGYGNPPGCHTGAYQDHFDYDNRLWAAAELYRATGERRYASFLEDWSHGPGPRELSSNSGAGSSRVAHAMEAYTAAGADGRPVDAAIVQENERVFLRRAKYVLRLAQAQPFSTGDRIDVPGWIGWGKFTYGSRVVMTLLKAWKKTGEQPYLDAARLAIGPQYGANPLSMSFVTGLGERYPKNPTCEVCLADDVDEPYPGIPVFGVFAHLSNGHPFYTIANHDANNFPYIMYSNEDRPVLTRYIDHKQIIPQSEYTISTMSHTLVAVRLLAKGLHRLRVRNATLLVDDGSLWGSIMLGLDQPYVLPTNSCAWLFDAASLSALGAGASCSGCEPGGNGASGRGSTSLLCVQLGSGASVSAGAMLTTRGPEVGYANYETAQWQQNVVVTSPHDGRRRLQDDAEAASLAADDAAASFDRLAGVEQTYESGVMATSNASAPEPPVSDYGAVGFDALALGEARSNSVGTQVDFTRGTAPNDGSFACPGDCSGRGSCLADIGECMCIVGSSGDACEVHAPTSPAPLPVSPPTPPPLSPPFAPPPLHPPFAPLSQGESIVTVVASVLTIAMTIAGSVEAFDAIARAGLVGKLKESLRCREPVCFLELRVSAASVQVAAVLTIPDASAGSASAVTDISTAASALASSGSAALSSTLGVNVFAITAPVLQQAVSVPLIVAPPPPSPTQPPLSPSQLLLEPPPTMLAQLPPSPPQALSPISADSADEDMTAVITIAAVAVATAGALLLVLAACLVRRRWWNKAVVQMDCFQRDESAQKHNVRV